MTEEQSHKPAIVVDFDTCLVDYRVHGWEDLEVIKGEPTGNSVDALQELSIIYNIKLYSQRFITKRGRRVVKKWLKMYDVPYDELVFNIPPHLTYISRKVTRFDNWSEEFIEDLVSMNPKL